MYMLILWPLFALLLSKIYAATTTISTLTTLSGDQTFSDDIVIESGATLVLESGSSYSFNGNIDVKGTLNIIGDPTSGLTSLQFASTTTITNSGNIDIENIKSSGPATGFVIAPASIDNSGTFTVSQFHDVPTAFGPNFTIAPTGSFINTGTIDYDTVNKGGTTNGFLYLGAITNNGVINTGGFSALTANGFDGFPSRYNLKGIVFNNPLTGKGKVVGSDGAAILLNTDTLGEQTFNIHQALYLINPEVVPDTLKIENYVGSLLVFLGVDYEQWRAENFGRLPNDEDISFGIDGHRYWLNMTCPGGSGYEEGSFMVTPWGSLYQIGGTLIHIAYQFTGYCPWLSAPITKTTTITTMNSVSKATTISTVRTSTVNQYTYTVPEVIYLVAVPPLSTTYTTLTTSISFPVTSTYTTTITDPTGSTTEEVVVFVQTPPLSTIYSTTTDSIIALTTSTFTTTTVGDNNSKITEVVVLVKTPFPSTTFTTTTRTVTAPTTSTYTTTVTDFNGSSSPEVVVVIVTPSISLRSSSESIVISTVSSSSPKPVVSSSSKVSITIQSSSAQNSVVKSSITSSNSGTVKSIVTSSIQTSNGDLSSSTASPMYRNSTILGSSSGSSSLSSIIETSESSTVIFPPYSSFAVHSQIKSSTKVSEQTETTLNGTLVVFTTVINGITKTTTYCPELSATSDIRITSINGNGSFKSIYSTLKNQQEGSSTSSTVFSATRPTIAAISTTTSVTDTVAGAIESRRLKTSLTTTVSQISQNIFEQHSSSPTVMTIHHGVTTSLVSYEGKGNTVYTKWGVENFIYMLLFMVI